jgi:hypothetical protein
LLLKVAEFSDSEVDAILATQRQNSVGKELSQ